jgi:pantoate--beta-alanine ligase
MEVAITRTMREIQKPTEMQRIVADERMSGKRIGVVPTMGYLHEGHVSLIREARKENDIVVLTIFVNPAQFGPAEDFDRYPRDIEKDRRIAEREGVDYLFHPAVSDMYPEGYATYVDITGPAEMLEGAYRPGHFRGVATIVLKLFHITQPDNSYFGRKDAQQLSVIKKMVRDLNLPVAVRPVPTVREADGLAMSSRNVYLTADERRRATVIYRALREAEAMVRRGETKQRVLVEMIRSRIHEEGDIAIDYIEVVDTESFRTADEIQTEIEYCIAVAVRIGKTRLIDNIIVS